MLFGTSHPIHQMLGIDHHGDGHDFPADADELVVAQMVAVFRDEVVEGPDRALVQKRHDGAVRHSTELVERRVRTAVRKSATVAAG